MRDSVSGVDRRAFRASTGTGRKHRQIRHACTHMLRPRVNVNATVTKGRKAGKTPIHRARLSGAPRRRIGGSSSRSLRAAVGVSGRQAQRNSMLCRLPPHLRAAEGRIHRCPQRRRRTAVDIFVISYLAPSRSLRLRLRPTHGSGTHVLEWAGGRAGGRIGCS